MIKIAKSADDKANIVRIKLNLKKFEKLLDADKLYDYIEQQYVEDKTNYLFIDEIQQCEGFERVINSIYEEEILGKNIFVHKNLLDSSVCRYNYLSGGALAS